jgi:hypothetical protein
VKYHVPGLPSTVDMHYVRGQVRQADGPGSCTLVFEYPGDHALMVGKWRFGNLMSIRCVSMGSR